MKTRIHPIPAAAMLGSLMAALSLGIAGLAAAPIKPLNLEQNHGEVRVILLRAGQVVLSNHLPVFVVTYVVEVPTNGAFSDLHFSSSNDITLGVRGKPIAISCPVSTGSMDFNKLPRQNELIRPSERAGKVMLAQETVFDGLNVDAPKIDVKLQFTWRKNPMLFDFKDVPLN